MWPRCQLGCIAPRCQGTMAGTQTASEALPNSVAMCGSHTCLVDNVIQKTIKKA